MAHFFMKMTIFYKKCKKIWMDWKFFVILPSSRDILNMRRA